MDIGDLNIGLLQSFIDNYEYLIHDLTYEIQAFQIEYSDLNSKIRNVISENEKITKNITYLINNQQHQRGDSKQSFNIENLKKQLSLITSEKDYTIKLWQNALATIDHLEDEVRVYQKEQEDHVSKSEMLKLKNECNSKIKSLEEELEHTRAALVRKQITTGINKGIEVDFTTKQDASAKIIQNLEEEILILQRRLRHTNKTKDELTKLINKQNRKMKALEDKNKEYAQQVNEAVQVVEAACLEKDMALMKERETKDEMTKISKSLLDVIEQAEMKLKSEVDQVKTDFNINLKNVLEDLKKAHSDSLVKQNEIDIYAKQCALLENEIARLQDKKTHADLEYDNVSKLLILEKNLERTFQKLLTSEKENIILNAEISRLKSDMKDMIRHFETDIKTREIEKTSLQNKIDSLKNELSEGDKKYLDLLQNLEEMKGKLLEMKQRFKKEMEQKQNDLQLTHSQEIEIMKKQNETTMNEMHDHLLMQIQLNQKWRSETRIIVANLESQVRHQKEKLRKLIEINWNLKKKLRGKTKEKKSLQDLTVLTDPKQIETKRKHMKIGDK